MADHIIQLSDELWPEESAELAPDSQEANEAASLSAEMESEMHRHLRTLSDDEVDELDFVFAKISPKASESWQAVKPLRTGGII